MENAYLTTLAHLLAALAAGGLIGLERSYRGRPAGFRTHTLVCMASSLLMLLTVYQVDLLPALPLETVRIDPTRMAQGIMTGIGFLGAGVIIKEGLSIRGLTTAASIWITASIGILIGVGFYFAATVAAALTLGALSMFRWLETVFPSQYYARLEIKTEATDPLPLNEIRDLIKKHACTSANFSYVLEDSGQFIRYEMTLRTSHQENCERLAETLMKMKKIPEFRIRPASE